MAGIAGLSKDAQAGLKQSLAGQSAPPNPQTFSNPEDRKPFNELFYVAMRGIPRKIEQALEHCPEGDNRELILNALLKATFPVLKDGAQGADQIDDLLRSLFPLASPALKQQVQAMFTPISPPNGLGGGAMPGSPTGNPSPAGGATDQPPTSPPPGGPSGDAGVAPLPA